MYAVIYKNRVIVGPMVWNRAYFSFALEKENIKVGLPRTAPEDNELPWIINEDARIAKVEITYPPYNEKIETVYGPFWDLSGNIAIASHEKKFRDIDSIRTTVRSQLAAERYRKETAGIQVTIQDTTVSIDTNRGSRDIFVQKYLLMADNVSTNWKFPETWLTLTKSEMASIVSAIDTHIQNCFDWEVSINTQIQNANTPEELDAIRVVEPQSE